jgi:FtsP/CotA-like multicopper oxidase with cupredoxin domain
MLILTGPHTTAAPALDAESAGGIAAAHSNDNRRPAGHLRNGILTLALEIRRARWFPEAADGKSEEVETFAERGGPATIPGPLIRIPTGTVVDLSIRNPLGAPLVLFGLHPRPGAETDSVVVSPGSTRRLRFAAGAPGTYFYWGSTTGAGIGERHGADSQLSGAFIVDSAGTTVSPNDRIFVMGVWGADVDSSGPKPWLTRDMMVINGKSWPYTERFEYEVGDSVHWRWLNPTRDGHPMHLHGFYYDVLSRGSWAGDTIYSPGEHRKVVTETMFPGGTMTMAWSPSRPGNWLFHCHFAFHVSNFLSFDFIPDPTDPDGPDGMDPTAHAMRGLILGIQVRTPDLPVASRTDTAARSGLPVRHLRLLAQSAHARYGKADGYASCFSATAFPPLPTPCHR